MGKEINMNQNPQVQINPQDLEDVVCDKCGGQMFAPVMLFKKISAVLSPNGQKALFPLEVYKCDGCGHINDEFLPQNV
jgi:DNA-directed RNA polymerase subunit RPC12/RpoP